MDDDFGADYDAWLADGQDWPDEEADWQPPDEAGVERLLRLVGRLEAEIGRVQEFRDGEVAKLDAWLEDRTHGAKARIEWAKRSLEAWARQVHPDKTGHAWNMPNGTLRLTAPKESLAVTDESAAVAWLAENHPDLVVRSVNGKGTKSLVKAGPPVERYDMEGREAFAATVDGEIVPGLLLTKPDKPTFTATAKP